MAHPKRRVSQAKRDKRRSHYKATAPALSVCSNCNAPIRFHHVCPECGYYRGKLAVEVEAATK